MSKAFLRSGFAEAEKISPYDESEPLTIGYNADKGDHKTWVEAVVNNIKNNLGIEVSGREPLPPSITSDNLHYLRTKRDRMGHDLPWLPDTHDEGSTR